MKRHSGFTLIETLVALLIVAVGYVSVAGAVANFADQRLLLEQRWKGHRVAWNRLQEQFAVTQGFLREPGAAEEKQGWVRHQGVGWYWQLHQEKARNSDLVRYQVDVSQDADDESRIAELSAFMVP